MNEEEKQAIEFFNKHIFDWTDFHIEHEVAILIKLIEKQQKEIEMWQKAYSECEDRFEYAMENRIDKQDIRDKIEELEEIIKKIEQYDTLGTFSDMTYMIPNEQKEILKELLGE